MLTKGIRKGIYCIMSEITIRSKGSLQNLELVLKEFELSYTSNGQKLLRLPAPRTDDEKMLIDISLSVFLAHDYMMKIVSSYLSRQGRGLSPEKVTFVEQKMNEMFMQVDYYRHLTILLVTEHLEKSNELFVDAFQNFVMRGFRSDVEEAIRKSLYDLAQNEYKESYKDYLKEFSNRLLQENQDCINYRKAYVEMNEGVMSIFLKNERTNHKSLLDMQLVKQLLGEDVALKLTEVDVENGWLNEVAWLSLITVLLPIEEIVVHQTVSVEAAPYIFGLADTIELKEILVRFCELNCSTCHS